MLSFASGPLTASIMFVGEAPGRLGADETGIPFHGDRAGFNFEDFLKAAGISRQTVFITNAVLCNPRDSAGNNASPSKDEIANCAAHLKKQIDILDPKLVVTLGATALNAVALIKPHELTLKSSVRTASAWYSRTLIPLYHPGQRALVHRSQANQRQDYQFVADTLRKVTTDKRQSLSNSRPRSSLEKIVNDIVREAGELSYFSLHKIVYLLEYKFWIEFNARLTSSYFIRQKDGPYCPELHYKRLRNIPKLKIESKREGLFVSSSISKDLFSTESQNDEATSQLPIELESFVNEVIQSLQGDSEAELKTKAYLTRPMRNILRDEKKGRLNLNNSPIEFIK